MSLAIRITATALELTEKKFYDYIADRAELVCAVEHPKDDGCARTHCHVYVQGCKVKYDAINNKLTQMGIPKGNEGRSIKQTYGDELKPIDIGYVVYMSKGKYATVYTKGLSAEEYEAMKSKWVERKTEAGKPSGSPKTKKDITDFTIYEEVYNILENTLYDCDCYHCNGIEVPYGQTKIPTKLIHWDSTDTHRHVIHAMGVIRDTRKKYRKMTNQRKMEEYLYMLINHRDINEYSASRMKKFLFS